jgi:hypothetical protein
MTANKTDEYIEQYYALRKAEFGFLERLELRQTGDPIGWSGLRVQIDLRSALRFDSRRLCLVFEGVRELRIGTIEGLFLYMIEIRSIVASQLEDLNYRVVEGEYDAFSFLCKSFSVRLE